MHYKAITKHLLLTSHGIILVILHTIADRKKNSACFIKKILDYFHPKNISLRAMMLLWGCRECQRKGRSMSAIQLYLLICRWGMKLIFWGRQCRHISFSRCKAIFHGGSRANLVHLDRLWSPASTNCSVSDGLTHPSCSPACLTVMLLTLSLVWYTHSVMDRRQHALWQDREISVCGSQACYSTQLGTRRSYRAALFNILPTGWGPCGQFPSTCLINVPSFTLSYNLQPPRKQLQHPQSQTKKSQTNLFKHGFHEAFSAEEGTSYEKHSLMWQM